MTGRWRFRDHFWGDIEVISRELASADELSRAVAGREATWLLNELFPSDQADRNGNRQLLIEMAGISHADARWYAVADLKRAIGERLEVMGSLILIRQNPWWPSHAAGATSAPAAGPTRRPDSRLASRHPEAGHLIEPTIRLVNVEAPAFVPGRETIAVRYAIDGPVAAVAAVKMVVRSTPPRGEAIMVEELALPGPYAATGAVEWDGHAAALPGGLITLKGSPYAICFELTTVSGGRSQSGSGSIRLEVHAIQIVADTAFGLDDALWCKHAVDQLIADLAKDGMPGDCAGRLVIDSPLFKIDDREMVDDSSARAYQAALGDGPTVPLLARVTLRSKSGGGRRSPAALEGTRILWDFELASSADLDRALRSRQVTPAARSFIGRAAAYEEKATQPNGVTAHVQVGGWRVRSADRFAAGTQWSKAGYWTLASPAARDWAAFTACGEDARFEADSAVIFLPGRMAGDVHRVRAVVDVDESLDVREATAPGGAPAGHRSNTIQIENWRRVPIAGNWIVGAETAPVDLTALAAEYQKAAMRIEPAPGVGLEEIGATWRREYQAVVSEIAKGGEAFLSRALEVEPGGYAVRFREPLEFWERSNADAPLFGGLWRRIKAFFGAIDEDGYKKKCDSYWYPVLRLVARRLAVSDRGLTALKFGTEGPHNQNPDSSFTAGLAPAIPGLTERSKALFFQFTASKDTPTLLHEIGHLLFLAHAPGHFEPGKQPDGFRPEAHDREQVCVMSYHPDKRDLCGACLLKLAGWNLTRIDNHGAVIA
jgi:hypothetical protein